MNPAQAAAVPSSGPPLSPQRWSIQADVHRMLATRGLAPVTLLVCQFVTPPEKSMKPHYVLAAAMAVTSVLALAAAQACREAGAVMAAGQRGCVDSLHRPF